MFLAENLKTLLRASVAIERSKARWAAKPTPLSQAERETKSVDSRNVLSFSVVFLVYRYRAR